MNKILSVVIPTYNMEKYLRRCLNSLIIQDKKLFEALEVIVVNDGSKDSSSAIAHEYQDKYPGVFRVIDKENGNYGSCVNKGRREANGKYFRTLDADDWFDSDALALFLESLMKGPEVDVVLTNYKAVSPTGKAIRFANASISEGIHSFDEYKFLGTANERLLTMHSITYNSRLVHDVNLTQQEGISYTDIEYCYFPLAKAKTFRYIDIVLYQYLVGRDGQTVSVESSIKHFRDYHMVASRVLNDYASIQSELSEPRQEILSRLIFNPVVNIFLITLVYRKRIVHSEYELMMAVNATLPKTPFVYNMVYKATYSKIPFYKIWKHFNIRIGAFIGK